jgi:HPt (histidine-containing phosphotransfer) domain-containing protein
VSPAVEFGRLRDIAKGNTALLHQLANVYVTQTSEQLDMLRAALVKRSAPDVQRIAHRCAGSSGTVGMDAIAKLFSKLEQVGRSGQLDQAEELTATIESTFVRVRASVKELPSAAGPARGPS